MLALLYWSGMIYVHLLIRSHPRSSHYHPWLTLPEPLIWRHPIQQKPSAAISAWRKENPQRLKWGWRISKALCTSRAHSNAAMHNQGIGLLPFQITGPSCHRALSMDILNVVTQCNVCVGSSQVFQETHTAAWWPASSPARGDFLRGRACFTWEQQHAGADWFRLCWWKLLLQSGEESVGCPVHLSLFGGGWSLSWAAHALHSNVRPICRGAYREVQPRLHSISPLCRGASLVRTREPD